MFGKMVAATIVLVVAIVASRIFAVADIPPLVTPVVSVPVAAPAEVVVTVASVVGVKPKTLQRVT